MPGYCPVAQSFVPQNSRYKDWFAQAENDLSWGYDSFKSGHFAQACFIAQQTAEKALKSLAFFHGIDMVKSHSLKIIANALDLNDEIQKNARKLDLYYISSRYPDAFSEGAPFEYFTAEQAKDALEMANTILLKIKEKIPEK